MINGLPNIEAFTNRLSDSIENSGNDLHKNKDLVKFLNISITYLKDGNNKDQAKQIAHFLMGKAEGLPKEIEEAGRSLPPELKSTIKDLLRTERYGIFKEDTEKTFLKLQHLHTTLNGLQPTSTTAAASLLPSGSNKLDDLQQTSTQQPQGQTKLTSSTTVVSSDKTNYKQYSLDDIDNWLFKGKGAASNELPKSKLTQEGRNKDKYSPKTSFDKVPMLGAGKISSRVGIYSGGVTDLKTNGTQTAAVGDSNNGDLLTGCGYAVAKAIVNAAGAGLQTELYNNYGVPGVMETTEYGKQNYKHFEGRGYALNCGSYEMKDTHGIDAVELLTVPMNSEDGVVNMYLEALTHSKDKDFIALPMAGMSHPVINNNSAKSAELTLKAVEAFYTKFPDSKLKIIFTIFSSVSAENDYKNAIKDIEPSIFGLTK